MKKIFMLICLVFGMITISSCGNKQLVDMTFTFDTAIICLPNGEIVEGKVESWKDFDDGDQVQVRVNGKTYLVHSENVALIT